MPAVNKHNVEKLIREKRLLSQEVLLYQRIMEAMRQGVDLEKMLKLVIVSVTKGLGYDRAGVFLVSTDKKYAELAMGIDAKGHYEKGIRLPIVDRPKVDAFSDIVFKHKKFFLSNNVPGRNLAHVDQGVLNNAVVPLEVENGRIIGLLAVDNLFTHRSISKSDLGILANYATQAGLAIESFRLHESILNLTVIDQLTGAYNRRYLDQYLSTEIARAKRHSRPCGLLFIDLDRFKKVNDRWGHAAGDEVLKHTALILKKNVRNIDTVARIGGEEFAIVLPETPPEKAGIVIERILSQFRETTSPILEMVKLGYKVTASIGAAFIIKGDVTPEAFMKSADKSLYAAKENGRDQAGPLMILPA